MSIVSVTINKLFLIFAIGCICVACSNKAQELDRYCQSGWEGQFSLSDAIYNRLSEHKYTRYVTIKMGSDRGAYGFYFLGQTADAGLFLQANEYEMISRTLSLAEVDEVFSLLPEDMKSIKGYTGKNIGSDEVAAHISCDYMKIKTSEHTKTLSFRDYAFMLPPTEPASRRGRDTLVEVKKYFINFLKKATKNRPENLTIIKVDTIAKLDEEAVVMMKARKTNHALFYEIP